MSKELKESTGMMSHQTETVNKETEIIFMKEANRYSHIVQLKITINRKKSSLEGLNSKCEQVEKNVQPLRYVN